MKGAKPRPKNMGERPPPPQGPPDSRPNTNDTHEPLNLFQNIFIDERSESDKYKKLYYQAKLTYLKEFLGPNYEHNIDYGLILKDELNSVQVQLLDLMCVFVERFKLIERRLSILAQKE